MSNAVEVQHLHKTYRNAGRGSEPTVAVADVNFTVAHGEVVCLLGPNGAGKTTTTEILEGYRNRSGGDVAVLGFDPATGGRAMRERIGIVPQEGGLPEDLTVTEAIEMYGACYPRRLSSDEVTGLVELGEQRVQRIGRLSGGQRRRVEVGLALVGRPDLIFLDEPTTGFDPVARRSTWSMLRRLGELGTSVLLTTHFMDEAEALADRIVVIDRGRVVADGAPGVLGGRATRSTWIETRIPEWAGAMLPDLGAADVELRGEQLRIRTAEPTSTIHLLTGWAVQLGVTLDELAVTRPSLEDIYLELIHSDDTLTPSPYSFRKAALS